VIAEAALAAAERRLVEANVESPRRDARLLLALAMQSSTELVPAGRQELLPAEEQRLEEFVARRAAREPFAFIAGRKEFWSLEFDVGPGVLVPRPETETLLEEFCRTFASRDAPLEICDFGTGSGCLLVAALREFPNAHGLGLDRSPIALDWAQRNIAKHKLASRATLRLGDWANEMTSRYDAILANPPYVRHRDIVALTPEVVRYEPSTALDGGTDGLAAYRSLAPRIAQTLKPDGTAFLEVGAGQVDEIKEVLQAAGLTVDRVARDLAGIPRCVVTRQRYTQQR
jgi:release factor glutamine methyltransferase